MKTYLLEAKDKPTAVLDSKKEEDCGAMSTDIGLAEVFLRNAENKDFRLRWKKDEGKQPRWIPAGKYKFVGYRIRQGDWMISSAGGSAEVTIEKGKTKAFEIDPGLTINLRADRNKRGLSISMTATGNAGKGVSIYHEEKRIPARYEVLGPKGVVSAEGTLEYG